jgi:hypothetical protein
MRYFVFLFSFSILISGAFGQTRRQAIDELSNSKQKSTNLEKIILAPDKADLDKALQENTGVFRLLPREKYDKGLFEIRGGGAYYSFVKTSHSYNDIPQIGLEQNYLSVGFYGASYGLIADLGMIPLATVSSESEEVLFLANYQPPTIEADVRMEQVKARQYDTEKATYRSRVLVSIGHSYALRAISFDEADVLVAFKIYRKDDDGSLIIFWKLLEKFEKPILERSK